MENGEHHRDWYTLSLLSRVSVCERTENVTRILESLLSEILDINIKNIAKDIIDKNMSNNNAKMYIVWAIRIRRGSKNQQDYRNCCKRYNLDV